jgi:hypothetical protein
MPFPANSGRRNYDEIESCTCAAGSGECHRPGIRSIAGRGQPLYGCRVGGKLGLHLHGGLYTPDGPVPAAAVGHFTSDSSGNLTGSQTRSVAGSAAPEDIAGSITVNKDCTASGTVGVYVGGVLQRTAVLALTYDSDLNHARLIFVSLTLPDNTNVPVVITGDGNRASSSK